MKKMRMAVLFFALLLLPSMGGVTDKEKPKILFDQGHLEVDLDFNIPDFIEKLKNNGFTVDSSKEKITSDLLSQYDVFALLTQVEPFSEGEIESVVDFVENGGGLIIFGEHGGVVGGRNLGSIVNEIPSKFGIEFNINVVEDRKSNSGNTCWPIIRNFKDHPVTKSVKSMVYGCGCSLDVEYPAVPLAWGNETTTAGGRTGEEVVILAVAEYGKGKVLVVGDSNFLVGPNTKSWTTGDTDFLSLENNQKIGLNMFKWAAEPVSEKTIINPEDVAAEGNRLFSQERYLKAKSKFEEAKKVYLERNDDEKAAEMQGMIDKCNEYITRKEAEDKYETGKEYYEKGYCNDALKEFEESKLLYDEIEDAVGSQQAQLMVDKCNMCLTREKADSIYSEGITYFNSANYKSAKKEFEECKLLYDEIADNRSSDAQTMIDKCGKYINAQDAYEKGLEYSSAREYGLAIAEFGKAKALYEELNLYEDLNELEKIEEMQKKIKEAETADEQRKKDKRIRILFVVLVAVGIISAVVVIFLKKPEVSTKESAPFGETVQCLSCGKENPVDATYCEHCGAALKSADELEKQQALETLRKKLAVEEISKEEYEQASEELERGL